MFQRVARTWTLFRASWEVLKADKELAVFPILSSAACLLLMASFVVPAALGGAFGESAGGGSPEDNPVFLVLTFAYYFGAYFVVTFFNTALVACAVKRLEGGDPTVGYGIGEAASRLGIILQWTLLAASVGMILRGLEERAGWLGRIAIAMVGVAWNLATFFVVPILVVERKGPFAALKESATLLKRTWGEQIVSGIGFGIIGFLLSIPGIVVILLAVVLAVQGLPAALAVSLGALGVAWFLCVSVVSATLQSIFQAALYLWARDGRVRGGFSEAALRGAVVRK